MSLMAGYTISENFRNRTVIMKKFMPIEQCARCVHNLSDTVSIRCRAFPLGIPVEIYAGAFDHSFPYRGDRGIRYQERKGALDLLSFCQIC